MSRYLLTPHTADLDVIVGYDCPADSLYACVFDRGSDDDQVLVNIGFTGAPVTDARSVLDAIRPYALIPGGLEDGLATEADHHEPCRNFHALQRASRPDGSLPL